MALTTDDHLMNAVALRHDSLDYLTLGLPALVRAAEMEAHAQECMMELMEEYNIGSVEAFRSFVHHSSERQRSTLRILRRFRNR